MSMDKKTTTNGSSPPYDLSRPWDETKATPQEYAEHYHKRRVNRLWRYKTAIDEVFGEGYAAKNSALLGAIWQADEIEEIGNVLRHELSCSVSLSGELDNIRIAQALEVVADAIAGTKLEEGTLVTAFVNAGRCLMEDWFDSRRTG